MKEKIPVNLDTVKDAMHAIYKLQSSLGIDLSDEDGYGHVYFALENALEEATK